MLLRHVLALVNPFPVALEEDLESGPSLTTELDGVALDDVSVDRFFQEVRQRPGLAMLQGFTSRTWRATRGLAQLDSNHEDFRAFFPSWEKVDPCINEKKNFFNP